MALVPRQSVSGAWSGLVADGDRVGLITNFNYDIDHGLQGITVLGIRGPIAYDQHNFTCSLTIGAYQPHRRGIRRFADSGVISVVELLPFRVDTEESDDQYILEELQVVNIKNGEVMHQFRRVSLASEGGQTNPNTYLTTNVRLMAVEKVKLT